MRSFQISFPRSSGAMALALLLAASPIPALAQHGPGDVREPLPGLTLPEGVSSVELPLETSGGHLILPVSVNGSEPLPFVLDTGMPMPGIVLFGGDHVEKLGLKFDSMRAHVGGAGGERHTVEARMATGARVTIGDVAFDDVSAIVMPPMNHMPVNHAGIIGTRIFSSLTVSVDYDAGKLVLSRPGTYRPRPGDVALDLDFRGGIPFVIAQLTGTGGKSSPIDLVLDFGALHAVSLNASGNDAIAVPGEALYTRIGRGISGEIQGHVGRVPSLTLGGFELKKVVATFPDKEFENPRGVDSRDGNLGMGVMERFDFTIDYAAAKLYIRPSKSFSDPFEWEMSGLSLGAWSAKGIEVSSVLPGSPAEAAGIEKGDLLVSLDGRPAADLDVVEVRQTLEGAGREVAVGIDKGEGAKTVRLSLRRLI